MSTIKIKCFFYSILHPLNRGKDLESQNQALHEVLSNAPKQSWPQFSPLYDSQTAYQKLHCTCNANRVSLIGLLLEEGLFSIMEMRVKKNAIALISKSIFGIRLRINMEPRKMGGDSSYLQDNPIFHLSSS